jgi:exonuclease III
VHASSEDKSDNMNDSFYEELERVLNHFQKYKVKILLGDWNIRVEREDIFKLTIGKESLREINKDNGINIKHCQLKK